MFTVQEIEVTKRAVLQDMDYGLFRISEDRLQRRLKSMQLAAAAEVAESLVRDGGSVGGKLHRPRNLSLSFAGTAVWSHGVHTPEPSP